MIHTKIELALEKFGNPRIVEKDNKIRISLEKVKDCQNLILLDIGEYKFKKIAGIIVHTRISNEMAEIIHIAINPSIKNNEEVLLNLINQVIRIYKRIKEVKSIFVIYLQKQINI